MHKQVDAKDLEAYHMFGKKARGNNSRTFQIEYGGKLPHEEAAVMLERTSPIVFDRIDGLATSESQGLSS